MGMVYEYIWVIGVFLIKKDLVVDLKEIVINLISNVLEKFVKGLGFDVELVEDWEKDYWE